MSMESDAALSSGDVMRRLRELEQQVRDLQTARRLPHASFTEPGAIRYFDAEGRERFALGRRSDGQEGDIRFVYRPDGGGSYIMGVQLQHGVPSSHGFTGFYNNDVQIFRLGEPTGLTDVATPFFVQYRTGGWAFALAEGQRPVINTPGGASVVWVDEHGLRRPRQSIHWAPGWFGNVVDGPGFEATAEAWIHHTYHMMRLQYRVVRAGNPTVQVRLRDVVQDATLAGPFTHSDSGRHTVDVVLPTALHGTRRYELQAQISSGSTSARVDVTRCEVGFFADHAPA